jgi:hypothetical protein
MYGLGHPDLAFWELPLSTSVWPRVKNTHLGRVEVSGGTLSTAQLITHLQWVVPDNTYQWEVQQVEENVFKVNFPSKVELVQVQHFGRFHVPDSSIILSFDFWKKEVQPVWAPEDVWVRVYGLPPVALDDYLALWALEDVFGKTKEIDIVFTRQNNVLRMFITCLDTAIIPDTWDLKIKNEFFRLRFEVEGGKGVVPSDVTMSEAPGDGGDDDPHGNQKRDESERNVNQTKNVGENDADKSGASSSPNLSANAVGMNEMARSPSEATRYDNTCGVKKNLYDANILCLSRKNLYSVVSEVAAIVGECMPALIGESPIHKPNTPASLVGRRETEKDSGVAVTTSIKGEASSAHGAPASRCNIPSFNLIKKRNFNYSNFATNKNFCLHIVLYIVFMHSCVPLP